MFPVSPVEKAILNPAAGKLISRFYGALSFPNNECMAYVMSLWEADSVETIPDDEWDNAWSLSSAHLFTKARKLQIKVRHRFQMIPVKRNER